MLETERTTTAPKSASTCPEFAWCTMAAEPGEHAQFHASADVLLGDPLGDGSFRSAWLVRDVDAEETSVVIEMRLGERLIETQVPAYAVAVVLAMAMDSEGRGALDRLLDLVGDAR